MEETIKFLSACKKAGYERITIGVADKRVPISVKIKKESRGGYWGGILNVPTKVVCGWPEQLKNGRPKIWSIVKTCGLTAGLRLNGCGSADSHEVRQGHTLIRGYYDLMADWEQTVKDNARQIT